MGDKTGQTGLTTAGGTGLTAVESGAGQPQWKVTMVIMTPLVKMRRHGKAMERQGSERMNMRVESFPYSVSQRRGMPYLLSAYD